MYNYSVILTLFVLFTCAACNHKTPEASKGTIKAGNLQVYYEIKGSGDPIVLLHAGLQNHNMWEEQVQELSKKYRIITIDLPYHGNTTGNDTNLLAKDVIRIVLDSLNLKKISIAGLSMGASVAQDFIIAYPERVNKVVLISAGINGYEKQFPIDSVSMSWYPRFTEAINAKDTPGAALEFAKVWAEGMDHRGDSLKKPASQNVYKTTLATLKQYQLKGWPRLNDQPLAMENISKIRVPVLIIHGDKDLPYITTASQYLEKNIPGAKRVLLKDVAHMLNMEKPDEVNRLLLEFLQDK